MVKKTYKVKGMDCASCAGLLELDLEDAGIKASCSYPKETLEVESELNKEEESKLKQIIKNAGYSIV